MIILWGFFIILDLPLAQKCGIWCGHDTPPGWVEKYQWTWATTKDLSMLFGTYFDLKLGLQDVDQFLVVMIKAKLKYWSSTHLSLADITLIVNQVLMSSFWYFIVV